MEWRPNKCEMWAYCFDSLLSGVCLYFHWRIENLCTKPQRTKYIKPARFAIHRLTTLVSANAQLADLVCHSQFFFKTAEWNNHCESARIFIDESMFIKCLRVVFMYNIYDHTIAAAGMFIIKYSKCVSAVASWMWKVLNAQVHGNAQQCRSFKNIWGLFQRSGVPV